MKPTTFRQIALGVSLPTFAVSPAVAKETIYLPSHVAARMLGGRAAEQRGMTGVQVQEGRQDSNASHAA